MSYQGHERFVVQTSILGQGASIEIAATLLEPIKAMKQSETTRHAKIIVLAILCTVATLAIPARADDVDEIVKGIVRNTRNNAAAAAELLKAAEFLTDAPKTQVKIYEKAYEYGLKSPAGYASAIEALDALDKLAQGRASIWQEKRLKLYRLRYKRAGRRYKRLYGRELAVLLVTNGDKLVEKHQWKKAVKIYNEAYTLAKRLRLGNRNEIRNKRHIAKALQQIQFRAKRLEGNLAKTPTNATIRAKLIQLYLVSLNSPQEAAKFLNDDCDKTLRTNVPLAAKPINKLKKSACLTLGQWYHTLAGSTKVKINKKWMLKRARAYLERYLDLHEKKDTARLKASVALKQVERDLDKLSGSHLKGAVLLLTFEKDTFFVRKGQRYIRDLSGKGNHGKVHGGKLVPGQAGLAMSFDKKTYLDFGNPPSLQLTGDQTISMWINPTDLTNQQSLFVKACRGEVLLTLEKTGKITYHSGSSETNKEPSYDCCVMPQDLKVTQWAHLIVVRNINFKKIIWYKNGIAVASKEIKIKPGASNKNLLLGKGYGSLYHGLLDEVIIFNRALSDREIARIHAMGKRSQPLRK